MADDLRPENLIGHQLLDGEGHSVGKINQVYLDDRTNEPSWVSVHTGLFGRKETLVPLQGAQPQQEDLQVPYDKATVKDAPHVESGAHISPETEAEVRDYYAERGTVPDQRGGRHERGQSEGPGTDRESDDSTAPGTGYSEADASMAVGDEHAETAPPMAATEPDADATGTEDQITESGMPGVMSAEDARTGPGTTGEAAAGSARRPDTVPTAGRTDADQSPGTAGVPYQADSVDDITMTRSEEQVDIGVERVETGQVRMRKYVDDEDFEETVTLRHEELDIERRPVEEGEGFEAAIAEGEEVFTLYEERVVVSKHQVPVERVHVRKRMVSHEERVQGTRQSERIELEDEEGNPPAQT
ncbi:DUF2382 domain-containing protein [Nocardiopsis kunsanensis]|uniref:Photosystem reaction center subunit H n=1 Tax=Nocardiopsis kunsanensis TaxID=141693 RepID=A0A919CH46_9ACTN|nr:DUF2382 domain-containing protein [Nocardiopsis kunsanensis]GHD20452.1 photosystem reaction center subunit H [Nocardiopsis kunsanensis]